MWNVLRWLLDLDFGLGVGNNEMITTQFLNFDF
jgi:hypothetical protein